MMVRARAVAGDRGADVTTSAPRLCGAAEGRVGGVRWAAQSRRGGVGGGERVGEDGGGGEAQPPPPGLGGGGRPRGVAGPPARRRVATATSSMIGHSARAGLNTLAVP